MSRTNAVQPAEKFSRLASALTRSGYSDFFDSLVCELSLLTEAEYVLIARIEPGGDQAHSLALAHNGNRIDNISYPLAGTPCETVPEREMCTYASDVTNLFPDDQMLVDLNIQSYTGMPILTSEGDKLGIISVMAEHPLELDDIDQELLKIAAAQVGAELELSRSESRIRLLTHKCSITGLPNRHQLMDWLQKDSHVRQLALINLRRFKDINDLYNHDAGDDVLRQIAERLEHNFPGRVARCANDEFALLPDTGHPLSTMELNDLVNQCLVAPVQVDHHQINLEAVVGVAHIGDGDSPSLLRHASVALAEAKAQGEPVVAFEDWMLDSLQARQSMLEDFMAALRSERLHLNFQPLFNIETNELAGAEVLCRWHDKHRGPVSPSTFIPLAEERGLIGELGNWVLDSACKQLRIWDNSGHPLPGRLSINVSNLQLGQPGFAEQARRQLQGLAANRIVLELTESAFMRSPETNLRQMASLKSSGYTWAIDDFGTGYSSLAYLSRLNAGILKIDRSFVSRIPGSTSDESIIRTIIAMARTMNMETVAEGVETEAQLQYLKSLGCQFAQGYYLGHPLPANTFADEWLDVHHTTT